ncbi:uncharacterized protein LOC126969846 [Leptidea sinapis]|uniref:MADF domain-containing protein n=1 Tax=Leptidea sinapis TaxID=189913 RepID=A0A5E4QPP4_9NEOP|nr:uncharacterized protein LOC126969846 [Leptidea sinapis]VVC99622.1 unnamed protein product [Leptidea sinapis]
MASYSFDAESFINEIKNQPYIWNYEGNKFRSKREKAWIKVARVFISDFDNLGEAEQHDVFRKLQSKWRNLRDNYVKSIKRNNKEYTYAKKLAFLDDVYNARKAKKRIQPGSDNSSDDERNKTTEADTPNSDEEILSTIDNLKRRRIERVDAVDHDGSLCRELDTENIVSDDDRAFFDSLVPILREFNIDQKLEFRSEVLKLVKYIRNTPFIGVKNETIEFVCSE